MLGIAVGWGGGTSIELAYMVVIDLAAKMAVGSRCEIHHRYCGCDLVWCCCLQCLPSQANCFFCLPAEVGSPTMVEWNAFECLCRYFSDGLIWSHLISSGSLPEVYSRVVLGALRTRPETTLSKTWGFADDMVSWFHGCEITIVIYCNLLYKHMALWDLWTEQERWTQGGSKDKTTSNTRHAGWIVLTDRVFLIDLCSLESKRIWTFFFKLQFI